MNKTGSIKLIYKGQVNNQVNYNGVVHRKSIIEKWREMYGMEFEKCAIQIRPEICEKKKDLK